MATAITQSQTNRRAGRAVGSRAQARPIAEWAPCLAWELTAASE
jgi:hypothetical protein